MTPWEYWQNAAGCISNMNADMAGNIHGVRPPSVGEADD